MKIPRTGLIGTGIARARFGDALAILSGFDLFRFMAMRSFDAYTGRTPDKAATLATLSQLKPHEETA